MIRAIVAGADIKALKPHITHDYVVIRYTSPEEITIALQELSRTLELIGQKEIEDVMHIPWTSCRGCRDPKCNYSGSDGYWTILFTKH